jgi:epoxyqueuosine reductase QueG
MKEAIKNDLKNFILTSMENRFDFLAGACGYEEPLVGVVSVNDPIFQEYKTIIGDRHLTPAEAFERAFSKNMSDGSVISVALPISQQVVQSNRGQKEWPSKDWTLLRTFGDEIFLPHVAKHLISLINDRGYEAVAPNYSDWFEIYLTANGPSSIWSERHIAFAAGLGTFSLNDAMITEKGIAVKLLSVVTNLKVEPDVRKAKSHTQNCLYLSKGTCGACIQTQRCPVGAISKEGHDKMKCYAYVYGEASRKAAVVIGASAKAGSGCGLCQSRVPCENKNPCMLV